MVSWSSLSGLTHLSNDFRLESSISSATLVVFMVTCSSTIGTLEMRFEIGGRYNILPSYCVLGDTVTIVHGSLIHKPEHLSMVV